MQTRYGVGRDWPVNYDELAPYYDQVEAVMEIAGSTRTPFPNRAPYPLPGHRMSDPDRALQAAYPDFYFNQPTARASRPTDNRGQCCANGVCHLCPVDAKFTSLNGMRDVYDDPRVTLMVDAQVLAVDVEAGMAKGVIYAKDGREHRVAAETVVMGANAIFNPYLLLRSGLTDDPVGQRLHEQGSFQAHVYLDGMSSFQGSSAITGHGYMLYDGEHRREAGTTVMGDDPASSVVDRNLIHHQVRNLFVVATPLVLRSEVDLVIKRLRDNIPGLRMEQAELERFAEDFLVDYKRIKARRRRVALLGARVAESWPEDLAAAVLPNFVTAPLQGFENRLFRAFFLGTDFLDVENDPTQQVTYLYIPNAYDVGCANRLAQYD
ncbi:MAG: GMC family oxidoreductase N-terminal domain-containing protein [Pseudomonadota bacterium]